jgi:sarcosine oxidase subunit delta
MSFALRCPNCGERPVAEFRFGGEQRDRPTGEQAPAEWASLLFDRRNEAGPQDEWWFHRLGCRCWFLARRDTRDNRVLATWWPSEPCGEAP